MPNWCANRLRVTGLAESVSQVRALITGGVGPLYARAEADGIQLFLAGCAGLLRPVMDETYVPYPALTAAGQGEDTPENRAFTQWLVHLRDGAALTDETCNRLHDLWLATRLRSRTREALDEQAKAEMDGLWTRKHYDWSGMSGGSVWLKSIVLPDEREAETLAGLRFPDEWRVSGSPEAPVICDACDGRWEDYQP